MSRYLEERAKRDAERAHSRAFWHQVLHDLRRVPNELVPFSAVKAFEPASERYGGLQAVEIDKIVGSVDRYRDFDHYFLPKVEHTLERWARIRHAGLEGVELPAIQVYKVGEIYFVKDGHHRVSVARASGQRYIDAEVIELTVEVPPHSKDSLKTIIIKGEYGRFLAATRLRERVQDHEPILFSVPGRYDILLEHIRTRQYFLGEKYGREVSWEEAVESWYTRLYRRVVEEIREHRVLERFPGRTEADLYLWIMDHRYYLTRHYGRDVGSEWATLDYVRLFSPTGIKRLWLRLVKAWRGELPDA